MSKKYELQQCILQVNMYKALKIPHLLFLC